MLEASPREPESPEKKSLWLSSSARAEPNSLLETPVSELCLPYFKYNLRLSSLSLLWTYKQDLSVIPSHYTDWSTYGDDV